MELKIVKIDKPSDTNIIIGQSHFIKTVEDLYEVLVSTVPNIKFGLAFCESSGPCLIRSDGNDSKLKESAEKNAMNISSGHSFIVVMKDAYPINVLNAIKNIQEVCSIYCATANNVEVIICETDLGRGILGVVDGLKTKGTETDEDRTDRIKFLKKIGYKQ